MTKVKLKKPAVIILEFTGCIATKSFMGNSDENKRFVTRNIDNYFRENYPTHRSLRMDVRFLYMQEREDEDKYRNALCPKLPQGEDAMNVPLAMVMITKHILWKLEHDFASPPLAFFLYHMTEWGYSKGLVKTPVYDEVGRVLKQWKALNIDIYIGVASAGFVEMVLSNTTQGNLVPYFKRHMNLIEFDGKRTTKIFNKLPALTSKPAKSILFITRYPLDARLALEDNIPSVLIMREDFDPDAKRKRHRANNIPATGQQQKAGDKQQPKQEESDEEDGASAPTSGIMHFSEAIDMLNNAKKDNAENSLQPDELGAVLSMVEDDQTHEDRDLDIRTRGSKIVTKDIIELTVIDNLTDLIFEDK